MKPLFLLGRTKRSIANLQSEIEEFESRLGLQSDDAVTCGDMILWPMSGISGGHRTWTHHPYEYWQEYKSQFASGLLAEYVIGEVGKNLLTAGETGLVDHFQGVDYMYGVDDEEDQPPSQAEEEVELSAWDAAYMRDAYEDRYDPYAGRTFWTLGMQDRFEIATEVRQDETPSFGRKLLVVMGRDPKHHFMESKIGQQLRARLGQNARIILNAQGDDAAAIAFEHHDTPQDLFDRIKRLLPPRMVKDFLIMDIGPKYSTGDQSLSVFAGWAELLSQRAEKQEQPRKTPSQEVRTRVVPVVKVRSRKPKRSA